MYTVFSCAQAAVTTGTLSAGGCNYRRAKHGGDEPHHVRGQGQKLGGPHARRTVAKRSYPTSEVRGISREYQTATAQEPPRGATPRPNSRGAAKRRYPACEVRGGDERSYPASEVRGSGQEELPHAPMPETRGRSREEQPMPEARGGGREDQPHVQGAVAEQAQEGLEELSHTEGQEGQR